MLRLSRVAFGDVTVRKSQAQWAKENAQRRCDVENAKIMHYDIYCDYDLLHLISHFDCPIGTLLGVQVNCNFATVERQREDQKRAANRKPPNLVPENRGAKRWDSREL